MMQIRKFTMIKLALVFVCINLIKSNPIKPKICQFKSELTDTFNVTLLKGKWYDVARSKYVYKENTWTNGLSFVNVDSVMRQINIFYTGLDNSQNCQSSQILRANYTDGVNLVNFEIEDALGSFKILNSSENYTIVSVCYDSQTNCPIDKLDLFVWSRNKIKDISKELKSYLVHLLSEYCITDENDLMFSQLNEKECLLNETDIIVNNEQSVLIADLKINDGLLNSIETKLLNKSISLNESNWLNDSIPVILNRTVSEILPSKVDSTTSFSTPILASSTSNIPITELNKLSNNNDSNDDIDLSLTLVKSNSDLASPKEGKINDDIIIITEKESTSTKQQIRFSALDSDEHSGETEEVLNNLFTSTSGISIVDLEIKLKKDNLLAGKNGSSTDTEIKLETTTIDSVTTTIDSVTTTTGLVDQTLETTSSAEIKDESKLDETVTENQETTTISLRKETVETKEFIESTTKLDITSTTEEPSTTLVETVKIIETTQVTETYTDIKTTANSEVELETSTNSEIIDSIKTTTDEDKKDVETSTSEGLVIDEKSNLDQEILTTTIQNLETKITEDSTKEYENNFLNSDEEKSKENEVESDENKEGSNEESDKKLINDEHSVSTTTQELSTYETIPLEEDEEFVGDYNRRKEKYKEKEDENEEKVKSWDIVKEKNEDEKEKDENLGTEQIKIKSIDIENDEDDDKKENDNDEINDKEDDASNEEKELNEEQATEEVITTPTTSSTTTTLYPCIEINCQVAHCNYGRRKDENGCNTCDCATNPNLNVSECTPPYCHPCFYGSYTDENGCESCACKPRPKPKSIYECPKLECASCNYGSIKDEYGCETCICIRPNSLERSYPCPPDPTCPFGPCKHGSILNDYGCTTCDCLKSTEPNRDECVRHRCPTPCPNGYFTDSDGCETCTCKPDWMAPCALSDNNCESKCEFGSYLDRNGCPSCECLPDPYLKTSCADMKEINPFTECDSEGKFKPKQCNGQECRCVTKDGMPISDFKTNISEAEYMNCECAIALYDVSIYKAIGFKLYCSSNGNYETIQCVGGSCACVNERGDPIGPSVPIYQKHLLRCEGVFQRVYYEQFMTTIAPTTLIPPLCVFHKEKALEMSNIDIHLSIPECDERGLYLSVQCDRQNKYCWCVNIHNGIELYGTRKVGERPECSSSD